MEAEDIIITLRPTEGFNERARTVQVDLSSRVNFNQYTLQPGFSYNNQAFSSVRIDSAATTKLVIDINENISFEEVDDDLAIIYRAISRSGDELTGKIVFPALDYEISAAPITYELDDCCSLPDKIVIDVRQYNGGRPVTLTGIGSTNASAATVTLTDLTGNDYNDDFNNDFGMTPGKTIDYTLNKATTFWKTHGALDTFPYIISYKGRTATNYITIKLSNKA